MAQGTHVKRVEKKYILSRLEAEKLHLRRLRERRVLQDPGVYLDERRIALDHLTERLGASAQGLITRRRGALSARAAALDAMSPLKVLARGYAIASLENGRLVRSRMEVAPGDRLLLRLSDGIVPCTVLEQEGKDETNGRE